MQYKKATTEFKLVDAMLVIMMIVPIALAILMKVLFIPVGEGIEITGAHVYAVFNMPISDLPISEAQVNSLAVLISILFVLDCIALTVTVLLQEGKAHFGIDAQHQPAA